MSRVEVAKVAPDAVREEVVDLLRDHDHWPVSTREDYRRLWTWRYRSLGDGEPTVWVARVPDGTLVGHYAVFPRRFRVGSRVVRTAVPGDLLVHRDWRARGVGIVLARLPLRAVRSGEWDLVLVTAARGAHDLAVRLGYRDLGSMHRLVDLRSAGVALNRRYGRPGRAAAPLVDAGLALRRRLYRRRRGTGRRSLVARELRIQGTTLPDRSHWSSPPDRLVSHGSDRYLLGRFLGDPFNEYALLGVFDHASGRLEGLVTLLYSDGLAAVHDCQTNAARLTDAAAISLVAEHLREGTTSCRVATLPGSHLARELRGWGFIARGPVSAEGDHRQLSAYWDRGNPQAPVFERVGTWNLYSGVADA